MATVKHSGGGGFVAESTGDGVSKIMSFNRSPRILVWLVNALGALSKPGEATAIRGSFDTLPAEDDAILNDLVVTRAGKRYRVKTDAGIDLGALMDGARKTFTHLGDFIQSFAMAAFPLSGASLGVGCVLPAYVHDGGEVPVLVRKIVVFIRDSSMNVIYEMVREVGQPANFTFTDPTVLGGTRVTEDGLAVYLLPEPGINYHNFDAGVGSEQYPDEVEGYDGSVGPVTSVSTEGNPNSIFYDRQGKTLQVLEFVTEPESHDFEVSLDLAQGISLFEN